MIDLVLGEYLSQHPIESCSELEPVLESPLSPPPLERGQQAIPDVTIWDQDEYCLPQCSHITGVAVGPSEQCGIQNLIQHGDCLMCGKSAKHEVVTFDYMERKHIPGEKYTERQRRRHAFHTGMRAGSFVLVPRELSQATACDGNNYQLTPKETNEMPLSTGVLPLWGQGDHQSILEQFLEILSFYKLLLNELIFSYGQQVHSSTFDVWSNYNFGA